jgi:hypothetical protein
MQIKEPTRKIEYEIIPSTSYEDVSKRRTPEEIEAQLAYNRGFLVHKHETVEALMTTGQKVTTTLTTDWRGR